MLLSRFHEKISKKSQKPLRFWILILAEKSWYFGYGIEILRFENTTFGSRKQNYSCIDYKNDTKLRTSA